MNTNESVRARAARATWAAVCAVLLLAVTAHASSPNPAEANQGQDLPVIATVPVDEAVKVRPDTAVTFQLDTGAPEYRAFRQQLENGRFALQVEDGSSAQLFLGAGRSKGAGKQQASAGEATFDAQTGTVSTPALSLHRYTTYTVTLAVKAAYEALLHGQPLPGNDSVSIAFITGSALREPTRYALTWTGDLSPRVTGKGRLFVSAIDDYGNAASGAHVTVRLTESGSRLASSAQATPAQATLPASGSVSFDITNTEAESVQVDFQASGAYPENAWSRSLPLRFRPGLPARALLADMPTQAPVATYLLVQGSVVDVYGNAVEDGTAISVGGETVTTQDGAFSVRQLLPTLVSEHTVQVRMGFTVLGSAVIRLLPGAPLNIRDLMAPSSMVVGSRFNVCGQVTDAYGNLVADDTAVTVNGEATTTKTGAFCAPLTAPTKTGPFTLTIRTGAVTVSQTVQARSGPAAVINDVTVPASVTVGSGFNVCGAVADTYGNAVTDGTAVTVGGVATTTKTGAFCAQVTAPTRPGTLDIGIQTGTLSLSKSTQVFSGAPAVINNVTAPASAVAASRFNVCGAVADTYGNAVTDGTAVTVGGVATTTRTGSFCAQVTAPTKAGAFTVVIQSGTVSLSRSIQVSGGPVAVITDISVPATVETNATLQACATAKDAHGNTVADGSLAYVQGGVGSPGYVTTSTLAGRFCGQLKAPSYTASFFIQFIVYDAAYNSVTASAVSRAVAPPPANISVSISPVGGDFPADGYSTATLTATVTDKNGKAVEDNLLGTWTTSLGTVTANTSHTSGGKVSAVVRSSTPGTAAVTVTVGSVSRTVYVTFVAVSSTGVAYVSNVTYSQSYSCYGVDNSYRNFGYGNYFRARQGCALTISGMAYTSSGAPARNAILTVRLSVDGGGTSTLSAYTDTSGRFTSSPSVAYGYGSRTYSYYTYDVYGYYRRVTDYWDWGNVSITSSSGQSVFTGKVYAVYYSSSY
ncbi:hypothetical protein ATI61_102243 [Archangium gephyra]|uniref:Bacterial Ig-like domain protein n=1 Tax=Archangium gephyra TaxID=48 RepID=A0AAC8TI32_9BACT|nr:Ig-like domain-containing protein [Archangium gephyra]AKJ05176.1 Putative Bacterial Ig-like domain protein [Archangium gephyra]REG35870.1 hypothetical protein ATI61_102243 [Archangium gephyra]